MMMLTSTLRMDAPAETSQPLGAASEAKTPTDASSDRAKSLRWHLAELGAACVGPFLLSACTIAFLSAQDSYDATAAVLLPTVAAAVVATIGFSYVTRRLLHACGALGETTAKLAAGRSFERQPTAVREINAIMDCLGWALRRETARRGELAISHAELVERLDGLRRDAWNLREASLALTAATPDLVFVTDQSGRIVEINERAGQAFGRSVAEAVGQPIESFLPDLCGVGPDDVAWDPGSVLGSTSDTLKLEGLTRDGRPIGLEGYAARWRDCDSRQRVSLVLRDVSAERRRYERLRLSREATRRENEDKTRFLLAMSDEVREPLNAVVGLADLLLEEADLDDESKLRVGMMRSAGASLIDVVSDAIDLARLDTGTLKLETKPFSIRTVLQDCVAAARAMAPPKDLALTCAVAPDVPAFVLGDAARFRQIAANLILNVMRLRRRGEAHVSLAADATREGWLRLDVTESGPGASTGSLDDMLRDLRPLDDVVARRLGGARMAMTIARRLTDLMDGRIGVSSRGLTSSSYYFEAGFPACTPTVISSTPWRMPEGSGPIRVLVVDDIASNREVAVAVMQSAKHDVESVGSAEEAIEAVRSARYDVVLMDVEMPDFDGLMATRAIRALKGDAGRMPIVALTAGVYPEQIAACHAAGMDDHIGKPVKFEELREKVVSWAAWGASRKSEEDPSPRAARGVAIDFRFVSNSVGQSRTMNLLDAFSERLEHPLSDVDDLALVAEEARALVSEGGMLGFRDLSRACQDLEEGCGSSTTVAPLINRVQAEAAAAREAIARFR